jgi:hypothetical protein
MSIRFIRPGHIAQAIANHRQPVGSELVPKLRETDSVERGRRRTGQRP